MGTKNFTAVIMNGEQRVCQYCQWDGNPSFTGAKILEFLRDVDMERFKQALENTKITLASYDDAGYYTGSTKQLSNELFKQVWERQCALNNERCLDDEYYGAYKTVQIMVQEGALSEQVAEDYIVSTRDTGCDILPYIYERSMDKAPLELFAYEVEFNEVFNYAVNPGVDIPGCDAQGYYIIDLDKNIIKMTFNGYTQEYALDNLPVNIDKEMLVFDKVVDALYEVKRDQLSVPGTDVEDEKGAGGLWDKAGEIALKIGLDIKEECPEVLDNPDEPICAEDFGQEYIYGRLCEMVKDRETEKAQSVEALVADAEGRAANGENGYCASIIDAESGQYLVEESNDRIVFGDAEDRLLFYDEVERLKEQGVKLSGEVDGLLQDAVIRAAENRNSVPLDSMGNVDFSKG